MCRFTDDSDVFFIGQVGGLASASAVFQSRLDTELHERLPPGSEEVCFQKQLQVNTVFTD
jgi:hypothetical protein